MTDYVTIANTIEKDHIINLLNTDRRLDGRMKNEFRDIKVETNVIEKANGSSIVHLGKTKVICGVKAVIGTPYGDSPDKGSLMVNFETSPLSAPEFRLGPPQDDAIEVSRMTDRIIRESQCIDLEKLCIIPGQKVWNLMIDIYSLDDYGNFFDACAIASFAALSTTNIPEVSIDDEENVEVLEAVRRLQINSYPVSVTFYKIGEHFVADANLKEEQISNARITIGTTETHIVSGQKGGLSGIKSSEMIPLLTNTVKIAHSIRDLLNKQIDKSS